MQEMQVEGVYTDPITRQPVVILITPDRELCLPLWISEFDALGIAIPLAGEAAPRPMPQDVLVSVLSTFGATVERVGVTALINDTFHGSMTVMRDGVEQEFDVRPSDGIAVAVRVGAPIFADEALLTVAGVTPQEIGITPGMTQGDIEQETQQFRSFLDNVHPEDFSD